jgi:hypothetical protein
VPVTAYFDLRATHLPPSQEEAVMDKLTLNVEELRVQSFVADDVGELRGTVRGQEAGRSQLLSQCCHTDEWQSCPYHCTP